MKTSYELLTENHDDHEHQGLGVECQNCRHYHPNEVAHWNGEAWEMQKVIECKHGTIRILNACQFFIRELSEEFPFFAPDTRYLDSIAAILDRPDWTETHVNEAVAALVEAEEKLQREEGE